MEFGINSYHSEGQVENAEVLKRKYGNGSTETEIEVRRKAAYQCLVPY